MAATGAKPTLAWVAEGAAHHAAGRLEAARAALETAVRQDPAQVEAWRRIGLIAQQQGRFADSLDPTRRAIALQATASDLANLANALAQLGQAGDALAAADAALALQPGFAPAQANRGVALRALARTDEAADAFRIACDLQPGDAQAHANLGVALTELGQLEAAEGALERAVALAPGWAQAWYSLGNARLRRLRLPQAETAYRRALALDPALSEAHANLGATVKARVGPAAALAHYAEAVRLKPDDPILLQNQALVLAELGRHPEAAALYEAAIARAPRMASLHANLGSALQEWARTRLDASALALLDRAILSDLAALALDPGLLAARSNLGLALLARGRFEEAVVAFTEAIARHGDIASLHSNLGQCLADLKRLVEAEAACRQALALDPGMAEAWSTLGNVLVGQDRIGEGEAAYREALRLRPAMAGAWCNLGVALFRDRRTDEADAAYARALELDPQLADAQWNQALVKLQRGELAAGFDQYEWRLKRSGRIREEAGRTQPLWDGRPLAGEAVLLYAEQGFGDAIQCVRFAPRVVQAGGRVWLQAREPLRRLFASAAGVERFVPDGDEAAGATWRLPLFSLPRLYARSLADLPGPLPYLSVPPELAARWRARVDAASPPGAIPRVGVVWSGNITSEVEQGRSIPLAAFAPLAAAGVALVSLQKGDDLGELADAPFPIADLGADYAAGDFADTAAALLALDALVCCDTAVAHLAGALGVPTLLAVSPVSDWRWLEDRDDSPWYPSLRLLRRRKGESWAQALSASPPALAALLRRGAEAGRSGGPAPTAWD